MNKFFQNKATACLENDFIINKLPGLIFWKDKNLKYQGANQAMFKHSSLSSRE